MPTVDSGQITPGTGQITYGASSVPTSSNATSTAATNVQVLLSVIGSNLGAGAGIYAGYSGNTTNTTLFFKGLVEGENVNLVMDNDSITISSYASFIGLLDTPSTVITNGILYGAGIDSIEFTSAPSAANEILQWNGVGFIWSHAGSGTVQTVNITGDSNISVTGSPITTNGTISLSLLPTGATAGTYFAPTVTIDIFGRVTSIRSEMELPLVGIQTLSGTYSGAVPVYAGLGSQIANFVSIDAFAPLSATLSSDNSTILMNLLPTGVTAGTYTNIVVNSSGMISAARAINSTDIITILGYSPLQGTASISSTPNTLVLRDSNGNATAASFIGSLLGNASTATSLQNTVNITIGGDVQGTTTFNGTADAVINVTLSNNGVTAGTYNTVVIDTTGRVIVGENIVGESQFTLTGDVTGTGIGSVVTTLAATGVTPGSYTSVIVNAKGLITTGGQLLSSDIDTALGYTPISPSLLGVANGIATLDITGKLSSTQLPASITGAMVYQGTWNALTNTPALVSGSGTKGYYYKVSVAGSTTIDTVSQWNIGDMIVFDGTLWDKIDGLPNEVISVAGMTGIITLAVSNITGAAPSLSPIFTGTPTAPTPALNDSSSLLATTSFVQEQIITSATLNATGDVTGTGLGNVTLTLSETGVTPGTYNAVVVDLKGRIQSATNITSTTDVTLTGDVTGTGVGTVATTLANTGVSAGTYTSVVVNTKGLVITASQLASSDVITALGFTPLGAGNEGIANGLATLDSTGKIPLIQIPEALIGAVVYQGVWNAATNTPTLVSSVGTQGNYYKVSVAGSTTLDGNFQWNIGDVVIFDGATWDKIDGISSEVSSVAGRVGAVTLTIADITGAAPLASPIFTGNPTAPNPLLSDSSTSIATTFFIKQQNYLTANQTITITGDAAGSGTTAIALTLASTGVVPGTYSNVVVDSKGRVISGSLASGAISGGTLQNTFTYQVNFDGNGNISTVTDMPSGWAYTMVSANELTITHGLGLFPQSIVCFGNNAGVFTMKTPNGNPTGQFSIGITSANDAPNTFTMYGVNSTAVNAAVSSFMLVQVLI